MNSRKTRSKQEARQLARQTRLASSIKRLDPDPNYGLSSSDVKARVSAGLYNIDTGVKTKTEKQIILSNVLTFFNILNFALAVCVVLVQSYFNTIFMGVIISNILIGSFQEIRAKRIIDKLSLIAAPHATVMRDGKAQNIDVHSIVLDDVMLLSSGMQICSDAIVVMGECEVNESLITGESDPVTKRPGDKLLSGSFVSSGNCSARVEHIGADNYASKIADGAKYQKKRSSEIMDSVNLIVKIIGFFVVPIGALLFWKQFFVLGTSIQESVTSSVAGLLGMIPEGLVLLISVVFAVSVIKLSTHKTLVQEPYCIETLARVDTLCLDKTGTITEGTMQVDEYVPFDGFDENYMKKALASLAVSLKDDNPTFLAIKASLSGELVPRSPTDAVPFSSARKWSGASFADTGTFIMGAGEFILNEKFSEIKDRTEAYSEKGQRVLLLVHSDADFGPGHALPPSLELVGLIVISDKIRREASRTLRFFADQGVDLKIISGDNPVTVSNIAGRAGLETAGNFVDATTLSTPEEVAAAVKKYSVFGRVTPQQKLDFVKVLKKQGHTVAMTGDGVNDVLALKEADCSVAMASGSDAAKNVSNLVLLDSNFASMPIVVQEGRRSINNLQRSASLFLVKTIFSAIIAVAFIFINYAYPFEPRQQTLISSLTIGIPSFILALEPNHDRLKGSFILNVLRLSIPAALTMASSVILLCFIGDFAWLESAEIKTLAVIVTATVGLIMLFKICVPFNLLRSVLFISMLAGFVTCIIFFQSLFNLTPLTANMMLVFIPMILFVVSLMLALMHFTDHVITNSRSTYHLFRKSNRLKKKSTGG